MPPHGTPSGRTPDRYVPGTDNRFSETKNNDSLYLSQQLVQTKIEVKLSMCWTYAGTQSSLSCQTWSKRLTAFVFAPGSDHKRSLSGECKHRLLLFHLKDETQSLGISTCSPVLSVIDCKRLSFSHFIKNYYRCLQHYPHGCFTFHMEISQCGLLQKLFWLLILV